MVKQASLAGLSLAVLALAVFAGGVAVAQSTVLTGTARDPSGAVIPNADVRLTRIDTGVTTRVVTNGAGLYSFPYLVPGTYHVEASATGFARGAVDRVVLRTGQTLELDLPLEVERATEVVEVRDSAQLQSGSGAVNTEIDRGFSANLPLNGRSFNSLLLLTPGVVPTSGGYSVNGQRESQNQYNVDGVNANFGAYTSATLAASAAGGYAPTSATGGTNTLLSTDALDEFQVQTSSYAPQYGRTPGGQIQITSRSGTERFHGTAFDYLRNNYTDANNWFNDLNHIAQPVVRQNDFGGTVGGPILRNRTFFFFSYEGLRLTQPTTVNGLVPSVALRQSAPAGLQLWLNAFPLPTGTTVTNGLSPYVASFPQTNNLDSTSLRIDHRVSDKLSIFGRYQHAPSVGTTVNGLSNLFSRNYSTEQAIFDVTWQASRNLTSDLRATYALNQVNAIQTPQAIGGAVIPSYGQLFQDQQPGTSSTSITLLFGNNTFLSYGRNADNEQRELNFIEGVTVTAGRHTFGFGFDYRQLTPSRAPAGGLYTTTVHSLAALQANQTTQTIANQARTRFYFNQYAVYAQDTWRVSRPLVLTYGVRYDVAPSPVFTEGPGLLAVTQVDSPAALALAPAGSRLYSTDYHDLAPRLGFAYDLGHGTGVNTVVRGGAGLFWDVQASSVGITLGQTPPAQASQVYANSAYPLLPAQQILPPIVTTLPFNNFAAFDPHLQTPYVYQYNLAVEQQLGAAQTLTINYVGSVGHHLPRQALLGAINSTFLLQTTFNLNNADANYNALQVKFNRRLSRSLQVLTDYSWQKSLDDSSSENGTGVSPVINGYRAGQDYGPSAFDIRHLFSFGLTYTSKASGLPTAARLLLGGWSIDPFVRIQSAPPVNVFYTASVSGVTAYLRPDRVAGQPLYLYGSQYPGGRALNPAALALSNPVTGASFATLRQGTLSRDTFRAFPLIEPDLSVARRFTLHEPVGLDLRLDAFNLPNHPSFGPPAATYNAGGFGIAQQTYNAANAGFTSPIALYQVGGPRSLQLSLKLEF